MLGRFPRSVCASQGSPVSRRDPKQRYCGGFAFDFDERVEIKTFCAYVHNPRPCKKAEIYGDRDRVVQKTPEQQRTQRQSQHDIEQGSKEERRLRLFCTLHTSRRRSRPNLNHCPNLLKGDARHSEACQRACGDRCDQRSDHGDSHSTRVTSEQWKTTPAIMPSCTHIPQ